MKAGRVMKSAGVMLAAGAVGAGLGMLFAPYSGVRTRRLIRRKAEDVGLGARDIYEKVKVSGNGAARTLYRLRMRLAPRGATPKVVSS